MVTEEPPSQLRLADGTDVPHQVGTRVYNYYDMHAGTIVGLATRSEPDTSGLLPGGRAWWVEIRADDDGLITLDGSRLVSITTAQRKGWLP